MFDSKQYNNVFKAFEGSGSGVAFVFYDRFTKKFGPLNICSSIGEVVYTACNYLKSVEDKNISLSHIDVYVVGNANVEECVYDLCKPVLFFNGQEYNYAYNCLVEEVQNV